MAGSNPMRMKRPPAAGDRNIRLKVAYDGGRYHGFQRQSNAMAIQNILEDKLSSIFGHRVELAAAGRTDAGVHARGQVVNFYTGSKIPVERIPMAVNSKLPPDIVIVEAVEASFDFHARYSARSKIYEYRIQTGRVLNPFERRYAWHVRYRLDVDMMRRSLVLVRGTRDFSAFCAAGGAPLNPVRTIYEASCDARDDILTCVFWGDGFLYHMVRNIVGTVVNVGRGKTSLAQFESIIAGGDRAKAGMTAPPQGLCLVKVFY